MRKKLDAFIKIYQELVLKKLYSVFDKRIKSDLSEFEKFENKIQEFYATKHSSFQDFIDIKKNILSYTEEVWNTYEPESFSSMASEFLEEVQLAIQELPTTNKLSQKAERFHSQPGDALYIKLLKPIKRFFWMISQLPKRVAKKNPSYWKHQIPVRGILKEHLINQLGERLTLIMNDYNVSLMKAYVDLHQWESAQKDPTINGEPIKRYESLKKEVSGIKRELKKQVIAHSETCLEMMEDAIERVDTIEMRGTKYTPSRTEKRYQSMDEEWKEDENGWVNSFDVLLESWRSELTLRNLMLQAKEDLNTFIDTQSNNINKYVGVELDGIDTFIQETIDQIENTEEELSSTLKKRIYQTQKELDQKLIPTLIEKLSNKNLINGISRLESSTKSELEKRTTERRIPKVTTDYLAPLQDDDITTISPYELIAFEVAPELNDQFDTIKSELVGRLNENLLIVQDMDHMISYGLSSAYEEYQQNKDERVAKEIAIESLGRSNSRVSDARNSLHSCIDSANEKVSIAIENYVDSIEDLTRTENVREIKLRIMRAKAIQSAEEYKDEMKGNAAKAYQKVVELVKNASNWVIKLKDKLTRKLTINNEEDVTIEVANFLIDSENIIESLPLIYRNLFRISPITDQELFVGRSEEIEEIKKAYNQWVDNKNGAVAIVGEKWGGLTSFINYIEQKNTFNYRCNRYLSKTSNKKQESLIEFFNSLVDEPLDSNTSWKEIADKLRGGGKKIIIVEDLQCLYLREIGGFETLTNLSELIQSTTSQIFWIVTCNLYSWQYFQKTINLDESFRFEIQLRKPTEVQIEELIQKRNRISGYKLHFRPSDANLQSKKFTKLSEDEQQRLLKGKFFKNLIEFSSSNVSMALMYWLLSTEEVSGDRIEIGEFKRPNFDFLNTISMDKITSLHLLILHDGLTIEQFAHLARIPRHYSYQLLASMYEDGILLNKNNYYMVNSLIYRSVINLLAAKNLL